MAKYNSVNERVKREYFMHLKEAQQQSEATIDCVAQALARFEADTNYRDFRNFSRRASGRIQTALGRAREYSDG